MAFDPQVSEIIANYKDRLESSTLPQDRRDACRGLKSLAKDYRVGVIPAMDTLLDILKNQKHDTELVLDCIDTLNYIISGELKDQLMGPAAAWPDPDPDHPGASMDPNQKICPSKELAEIFLKNYDNVKITLDCLNENDFKIRWGAIKLLFGLCRQKLTTLQSAILSDRDGVSRLAALLGDEHDVLRNDGLALFVRLTQSNPHIQNLFLYETGFAKLMYIIEQEGYLNGTVAVVMDVLYILLNLLQTNVKNRKLFLDEGHLPKLLLFFEGVQNLQWDHEHKAACIICVLQILDAMVSANNTPIDVLSSKRLLIEKGLPDKIDQIITSPRLPISVLYETLNTASDIFRGSNPTLMVPAQSMIPILSLSIVKDTMHEQESRLLEYEHRSVEYERRLSEQERMLTDLHNYINSLYQFMNNSQNISNNYYSNNINHNVNSNTNNNNNSNPAG